MAGSEVENGRGRVRGQRLQDAVLAATIARIEDVGISRVRVIDVAKEAGVHETSIYRRWKTLPRLLIDALVSASVAAIPVPDTGSTRRDLEEFTAGLARFTQTPHGAALTRGIALSEADPEVDGVLREFWEQRLQAVAEIVQRGQRRGEVRPEVDARLVVEILSGLVVFHTMHLGGPMLSALTNRAVAMIFPGISHGAN
ncbi:TetR/AcrR family transcriptional regulator C-terminal ligand-binding domain-containing protein [Nocardia sp. R7R-8]|uniref:TetR/AcrR family transcriptional regulator C-terminal ligand-binding domain-containing protein n=1 Tax=Nocardia sp. R7R-8 TaxID=3459304 RepID=UPI00403E0610